MKRCLHISMVALTVFACQSIAAMEGYSTIPAQTLITRNKTNNSILPAVTALAEIGLTAGAAKMAYTRRNTLAPHCTWKNGLFAISCHEFANTLTPDWLKDLAAKIPLIRRLDNGSRRKVNNEWCKNSILAGVEYVAGTGLAYYFKKYLTKDTMCKAFIAQQLYRIASPEWVKRLAYQIPVIRRLV